MSVYVSWLSSCYSLPPKWTSILFVDTHVTIQLHRAMSLSIWFLIIFIAYLTRRWWYGAIAERYTRVATDDDREEAFRAFYRKKCIEKGNTWSYDERTKGWDCHYTEANCKADSSWPEHLPEGSSGGIPKFYHYWHKGDGKCYLGNAPFKKKCEEMGLTYLDDTQQCRVNAQYCKDKLLLYKDGDCAEDPIATLNEKIFGKTLGRAISMAGISGFIRAANWDKNGVM